jgi:hypothetical protein
MTTIDKTAIETIETGILAVPERRSQVEWLQRRLDHNQPNHLYVHWDNDHSGHADAYRRAADDLAGRALVHGASHIMVIEDDAVPCQRFLAIAKHLLGYVPANEPLTFFTRNNNDHSHNHWLRLRGGFINTQACVWPVATWIAISAWMGSAEGQRWRRDHTHLGPPPIPAGSMRTICADNWWSERMRQLRMSAWATVPSLVDHRPGRSVIAHHGIGRAARWIGPWSDPFGLDWTRGSPLVPMSKTPTKGQEEPVLAASPDLPGSSRLPRAT